MHSGLAALVIVLIVTSLGLILAISMTWTGLSRLDSAVDDAGGSSALRLAESCLESGWIRFRRLSTYSGESLSLSPGSCIITVSNSVIFPGAKEITAISSLNNYAQGIRSTVTTTAGLITVLDWQQLQNF